MIIRSSHLALRFYEEDGWRKGSVRIYTSGKVIKRGIICPHDKVYYIPDINSLIFTSIIIQHGHSVETYKLEMLTKRDEIINYISMICSGRIICDLSTMQKRRKD